MPDRGGFLKAVSSSGSFFGCTGRGCKRVRPSSPKLPLAKDIEDFEFDGTPINEALVLDELGYLPFAQAGGQLLFYLISRLYEKTQPAL